MRAVFKRAGESYTSVGDVDNSLKALQQYVGGFIETVSIPRTSLVIIMNEEGKLRKQKPNIRFGGDVVVGNILIAAYDGEGNFRDLTIDEVNKAVKFLKLRHCKNQGCSYEF